MSFNTALSQLIAINRTWYSAYILKSLQCKASSKNLYKHVHSPSKHALYSHSLQGQSGIRFDFLLDTGVIRVFHCSVLVEDTCRTPPTSTVVALLSNNIQGKTYISINPEVFIDTVLVLISHRNGTALNATKQAPVVVNLKDDNGDAVSMVALSWDNTAYPTPSIFTPFHWFTVFPHHMRPTTTMT